MIKPFAALFAASVFLSGCSNALVGEPPLVSRASGDQALLPDCKNVSGSAPQTQFDTENFLTTWGSAVREGAALGVREGLAEGGGVGNVFLARLRQPQRVQGETLLWRSERQEPFCMTIARPESTVASAFRATFREMRAFGYSTRFGDGTATTSFAKRGHRAANWMDRFSAYTYALPGGKTAVVVRRDVLISRRGEPYVQAISVGALEGWVLTRIRDKVLR